MIDWSVIAWKGVPFVAAEAKKWWRRDTGKNLSRCVIEALDDDARWAQGLRDNLVTQWLAVRDDEILATIAAHLLADPEPDMERRLEQRLLELLDDLPLPLGVAETAGVLSATVLGQLGAAQGNPAKTAQADQRRTQSHLAAFGNEMLAVGGRVDEVRALAEENQATLRELADRPAVRVAPLGAAALILPGDLGDSEQRILAQLDGHDPQIAARLGLVLKVRGPGGLDELLTVPPSWATDPPIEFWSAVQRLAICAGLFDVARAAAEREADYPTADRPGALINAARSAYAAGDDAVGDRLYDAACHLESSHPSVLLCAAERARDDKQRLDLADQAVPRSDRQEAWRHALRAFGLLGLGRNEEAAAAASASVALDPHGAGVEARHMVHVYAAVAALPERPADPRALTAAAQWFLERSEEHRDQGRPMIAAIAASRAALALAVAGDRGEIRRLIDSTVGDGPVPDEAAWNFGEAAMTIGESARALTMFPATIDEHARLQRAAAGVFGNADVDAAVLELDELVDSSDAEIARSASIVRIIAAQDERVALPEWLAGRLENGECLLAHARARRAAAAGDLRTAQQLVAAFTDPASIALRVELAEQAGEYAKAIRLAEQLVGIRDSSVHRLRLASLRARAGDFAGARSSAMAVANDERQPEALRRDAFSMAAQVTNDEGNFPELVVAADAWLTFEPGARDAVWLKAYGLARQRRYAEAVATIDSSGALVDRDDQAFLLAESVWHSVEDPIDRLTRLNELSDARGRPERLEYALIMAALELPDTAQPGGDLDQRLKRTFAEFGDRFPDSSLLRVIGIDEADPGASLVAALEAFRPTTTDLQERIAEAAAGRRVGTTPTAFLAALTGTSTPDALSTWGPLPLAVMDDATRQEERRAAERALDETTASWDATAITVVCGLPGAIGEQIRGLLATSQIGQATFDDVGHAEDMAAPGAGHDDSAAEHRHAAGRPGGFAAKLKLTADVPGGPARGDEHLNQVLTDPGVPLPLRAFASAISVARSLGIPLYSDDRAVRFLARGMGVAAFGTVALLDAVTQRGDWSADRVAGVRAELVSRGAWGLGLSPDEVVEAIRACGFTWDATATAIFSDLLAHRVLPRGLVVHAGAVLLAVGAEVPEQLDEWTPQIVAAFAEAFEDAPSVIRFLLVSALDLTAAPDVALDTTRGRVIRALRTASARTDAGGPPDPLIILVNDWLHVAGSPQSAAALLRTILNRVDAADHQLLMETFVRDDPPDADAKR